MKAFLPARRLLHVVEPEADEEVGGEPHALPADEEHEERLAQHQQRA